MLIQIGDYSGIGTGDLCDHIPHWGVTSLAFIM